MTELSILEMATALAEYECNNLPAQELWAIVQAHVWNKYTQMPIADVKRLYDDLTGVPTT